VPRSPRSTDAVGHVSVRVFLVLGVGHVLSPSGGTLRDRDARHEVVMSRAVPLLVTVRRGVDVTGAKLDGIIGVPHGDVPFNPTFFRNIGWRGGPAPARIYIPELVDDVLAGTIYPGLVLDFETDLDSTPEAYAAMDERRAI